MGKGLTNFATGAFIALLKRPIETKNHAVAWRQLRAAGDGAKQNPSQVFMKNPVPFLSIRLSVALLIAGLIAGLALFSMAPAFAQKSENVSPNDPKVTICYQGQTIQVLQSQLLGYIQSGATLGPCGTTGKVAMCYQGRTIFVRQNQVAYYLGLGATPGPCQ